MCVVGASRNVGAPIAKIFSEGEYVHKDYRQTRVLLHGVPLHLLLFQTCAPVNTVLT